MSPNLSALRAAFGFLTFYALGFGAFGVLVGSFVGLHILAFGFLHILIGLGAVRVAMGLRQQPAQHWYCAVGLSAMVVGLSLIGVISCLRSPEDAPAAIVFVPFLLLFLVVLIQLFRAHTRSEFRVPGR